jgi:hypothetical protein
MGVGFSSIVGWWHASVAGITEYVEARQWVRVDGIETCDLWGR